MNHVTAIEMQIHAFCHDAASDQNFRIKGRIEGQHDPVPRFLTGIAVDTTDIGHQSRTLAFLCFIVCKLLMLGRLTSSATRSQEQGEGSAKHKRVFGAFELAHDAVSIKDTLALLARA